MMQRLPSFSSFSWHKWCRTGFLVVATLLVIFHPGLYRHDDDSLNNTEHAETRVSPTTLQPTTLSTTVKTASTLPSSESSPSTLITATTTAATTTTTTTMESPMEAITTSASTTTSTTLATKTSTTTTPPFFLHNSSWTGPPDLATTLASCRNNTFTNSPCLMYSLGGSGMGAQVLNIFATKLYAEEVYQRTTFLVDETAYPQYATNDGTRLLRAYFTPQFALLEQPDDPQMAVVDALLPDDWTLQKWQTEADRPTRQELAQQALPNNDANKNNNNNNNINLVIGGVHTFHKFIHRYYEDPVQLYYKMIPHVCPSMKFNDRTWSIIQQMRLDNYGFASLRQASSNNNSVAFHVRRTDKLVKESRLYTATEYVDKLLQVLPLEQLAQLEICFLATDDAAVVPEMQAALDATNLPCRLVTTPLGDIPTSKDGRYESDATLVFLTELSMMVEATYFVGTFNSNVGELAAVLRACPGSGIAAQAHFAQSYGVDQENWMLH